MVTYPEIRSDIRWALQNLKVPNAGNDDDVGRAYEDAEEWLLVEFELDDTTRDRIPAYFWNAAEADAVGAVAQAIAKIWHKYPNDAPDKTYWTDPDWSGVVDLARKAHALMVENDRKHANDGTASDT